MPGSAVKPCQHALCRTQSGPKPIVQASLFAQDGDPDSRLTHEVDPDFLEFARREEIEEPEPTWEP